jgi:eukaryotic-like serine/threonine-protein kinase
VGKEQAAVSHVPEKRALDGRYRLESEIGAGGLGVVYRATHEKLAKSVAIKLLHAHCGENPVMRGRFEREAKTLASLDHPNIVAVTDFGIADDTPYLVMELLEGETLADRLSHGALAQAEAATLSQALLRALAFVHGRGLVHRDVKPCNVFLQRLPDGGERLKVLDFGLAKLTAAFEDSSDPTLTRAGSIVGTPSYMSPEQASGEVADARSDVYAAGVIVLQMLAGRLPFLGDAIDQLRSHLMAPVPKLHELCASRVASPELEAFIERAMAKRREERFANAGEMLEALEALPEAWFSGAAAARERNLALAKTLLAGEPVTVAGSAEPANGNAEEDEHAREQEHEHEPVHEHPRRRGDRAAEMAQRMAAARAGLAFVLVVLAAVVVALVGAAYAAHHPELALPAALELRHTAPHKPLPSASAAMLRPAAEAVPPPPAARSEGVLAAAPAPTPAIDSAADDSARHTQPIESESDEMPTLANAAPKPRVAARNPWRSAIPKELRALRTAIQNGARGSDHSIATLRRYNREHPTDARGHLLIGSLYLNRDWRADAINQYSVAYQIDPSARGAPELLPNLLGCVTRGFSVNDAERLIDHAYGREALPAVERLLRSSQKDARAVARLTGLKARLSGRDP